MRRRRQVVAGAGAESSPGGWWRRGVERRFEGLAADGWPLAASGKRWRLAQTSFTASTEPPGGQNLLWQPLFLPRRPLSDLHLCSLYQTFTISADEGSLQDGPSLVRGMRGRRREGEARPTTTTKTPNVLDI